MMFGAPGAAVPSHAVLALAVCSPQREIAPMPRLAVAKA